MLRLYEDDAELRIGFRNLGFRLCFTEEFFLHDSGTVPVFDCDFEVYRITSILEAKALVKAARRCQILPEHLDSASSPVVQFVARDGDRLIGWAQSIPAGIASWCSNVFVLPEYRRKGIARCMLSRLLANDRASGANASVLLASHAGSLLYLRMGYTTIGKLYLFTPPRPSVSTIKG